MHTTTLQQLSYVIEIANCGSINKAAKRLFISQPSLSNAIRELENELGIIIFDRTNRGISLSSEGIEFLGYARQIIEQAELMKSHYGGTKLKTVRFSVSTQHYYFAVEAFVKLMLQANLSEFEFGLKETKTYEIIDNVKTLRSEVGILHINEVNSKVMNKLFSDNNLKFTPLFNANPHVFIGAAHPFANKKSVLLKDMEQFPYITFEQGDNSSLHFSEEMLNNSQTVKSIKINDRATLFNLLTSTDSYTVGTGIAVSDLKDGRLRSIPVECNQIFTVGWITHKDIALSKIAESYINILNDLISANYFDLNFYLL